MRTKLPNILGIVTLLLLLTPALEHFFRFKNIKPLNGVTVADTTKTDYNWWTGGFQNYAESYATDSLFFRPSCIRVRNQFEFTFFDKVNAADIYESNGIFYRFYSANYNEHTYFSGETEIRKKVKALADFQQLVGKDKLPVYVIITPSKLHYFRDELPDANKTRSQLTNYLQYKKALLEAGIEVFDVDGWYASTKSVKRPPVMSKSGVHWTLYGGALAMDSLMKRINSDFGNRFESVRMDIPERFRLYEEDRDAVNLANLLFWNKEPDLRVPDFPAARHPEKRLRPVVISDSYFHVIDWTPLHDQIFDPETPFYYYFHTRFAHKGASSAIKAEVLKNDLSQADCIIIITDIQNLERFGYGFPEYYLEHFPQKAN